MKINNFRGDLTDILAEKEALAHTRQLWTWAGNVSHRHCYSMHLILVIMQSFVRCRELWKRENKCFSSM